MQRLPEEEMTPRQKKIYSMRCGGTSSQMFDTPTEDAIVRREMPLAFFVQHQRIKPTHLSQWYEGPNEKFMYLSPLRALIMGEEVCYDYNMDAKM
jgi:hypothetical protein